MKLPLWRRHREEDLEGEIQSHLRMAIRDRMERGEGREEAEHRARSEFGNIGLVKEVTREMWGWTSLERLAQDLRYAFRMMRRSPGFTAVAVLTLALGIGANTAIFSLVDAVLLRSLPVRDPDRLVLFGSGRSWGMISGISRNYEIFSYPQYRYFRELNRSFSGLCAFGSEKETVRIRKGDGAVETATSRLVSGNYFSVLGVPAAAGRLLSENDDRPGAAPAVVISDRYWSKIFHRSPAAVGGPLEINGMLFTIVGVTPPEFFGESLEADPAEMWLPINTYPEIVMRPGVLGGTDARWLLLVGRLAPGTDETQAQAGVTTQLRQFLLAHKLPDSGGTQKDGQDEVRAAISRATVRLTPGGAGVSHLRTRYSEPLQILFVIVALVLVIACANLAGLLVARAAARRREISVRLALGAGRGRLIRQFLTESILLSLFGGLVGLFLALTGTRALLGLVFRGAHTVVIDASPDLRALVFLLLISLAAGVLFGMAPALHALRSDLNASLRSGPQSAVVSGRRRLGLGKVLVVAQVALSLLLIVAAGLFVRTLVNLVRQDLGFDRRNVVLVRIAPQIAGYKPEQLESLYQRIRERVTATPRVLECGLSLYTPLTGENWSGNAAIGHYTPEQNKNVGAAWNRVSAGYFESMGIPVLMGRGIGPQDLAAAPDVAVINQTFARRYFPNENPVGQRFGWTDSAKTALEIVGVVKDTSHDYLRDETPPMFFLPLTQKSGMSDEDRVDAYAQNLVVRFDGKPTAASDAVRRALRTADPGLPVIDVTTLDEQVSASMNGEQLIGGLASFFGLLALVLACVGLYGLMAHAVTRRTNEIGIRVALGAGRGGVLWMVLREALTLAACGLVLGLPLALAATRIARTQLYGVTPYDPLSFAGAMLLLAIVTIVAGLIPARRAAQVDPMVALRYE